MRSIRGGRQIHRPDTNSIGKLASNRVARTRRLSIRNARGAIRPDIEDSQSSRLEFIRCLAFVGKETDKDFLGNMESGETVWRIRALGRRRKFPMAKQTNWPTKRLDRFYVTTKPAYVKQDPPPKHGRDEDLDACLVSAASSLSDYRLKNHPQVRLNPLGAEMEDIGKTDVRTLSDATQGWANRNIVLTTQPTRPGLPGAMSILVFCKIPPVGNSMRKRRTSRPYYHRKNRSTCLSLGPNGIFYSNNVGTFGVVSDGGTETVLLAPYAVGHSKDYGRKRRFNANPSKGGSASISRVRKSDKDKENDECGN